MPSGVWILVYSTKPDRSMCKSQAYPFHAMEEGEDGSSCDDGARTTVAGVRAGIHKLHLCTQAVRVSWLQGFRVNDGSLR